MKSCLCFIVLCSLALSGPVISVTYYIQPDGVTGTIQDAIDNLNSGDTIIATHGTYKGPGNRNIDFGGKAITLRSEDGAEATTIDCEWGDAAFTFHSGEGNSTVVDGFTITRGSACIVCSFSSPTIANCTLIGNSSAQGGAIYCNQSSPIVFSCWIHDNSAVNGGGIFCTDHSDSVIAFCTISASLATDGGGIYCWDHSKPVIAGCWITANTAGNGGGGVLFAEMSSPTISACWITGNTANYGGGILCGSTTGTTVSDTWIAGNRAIDGNGGGIFADKHGLDLVNCTISGNSASIYGGGFFGHLASPHLTGTIVCGNKAESDGGGLYLGSSNYAWIVDSRITGNTAGRDAGGIYATPTPWMSKSIIAGNRSAGDGGGILLYEAMSTMKSVADCTIAGNDAEDYGGGIYCDGTTMPITNCTIAHNKAYDGGGAYADHGSFPVLTNCILWGDTPNEVTGSFSNPTLKNCDIQGGWTGDGANNIYAYPQFVGWSGGTWTSSGAYDLGSWAVTFTDANADWIENSLVDRLINPDTSQPLSLVIVENTTTTVTAYVDWQTVDADASWVTAGAIYEIHDYRLSVPLGAFHGDIIPSPCIDAGDNDAPGMSALDCDSNLRIWDIGMGWTVDIGAYECGSEPFAVTQMTMNGSGHIELAWNSSGATGTTYDLWYSDDDISGSMTWNLLQSGIPTGGASTTYTDTSAPSGSQRYYMISTPEPGI